MLRYCKTLVTPITNECPRFHFESLAGDSTRMNEKRQIITIESCDKKRERLANGLEKY